MSANAQHWDRVYEGGDTERSWYQPQAELSVALIDTHVAGSASAVVDVGGGASTLVDDLVRIGYSDLTILDISGEGLTIAQRRLGAAAADINWVVADVTEWRPPRRFDLWHDRAVLHFMTAEEALHGYRTTLLAATSPGSAVVLGVFGPEGPTTCSGLTVRRWSAEDVADFLGVDFEVRDSMTHTHITPSGASQQFLWTAAQRR